MRRDTYEMLQEEHPNGRVSADVAHRVCNRATKAVLDLLQESNTALAQHLAPKVALAIKSAPTCV